jgi:hypothetical protein
LLKTGGEPEVNNNTATDSRDKFMKRTPNPEFNRPHLRSDGPVSRTEVEPSSMESETSTVQIKGRPNVDIVGKFDPLRDEPHFWLKKYIYYGHVMKLKEIDLANMFGLYLLGSAFNWFFHLPDEVKNDFKTLTDKFILQFGKRIDPIQIHAELFQMKQGIKQSIRDFITQVQQKARLGKISEEIILSAIINGVLPHIKADLRRNPPSSLDALLNTAELSESANSVMPAQVNFSEQALSELLNKAMGVHLAEIKGQVNQIAQNQASVNAVHHLQQTSHKSDTYRQHPRSNFKDHMSRGLFNSNKEKSLHICYRCGRKNPKHAANECYALNKDCHKCGKKGHIAPICQGKQKSQ